MTIASYTLQAINPALNVNRYYEIDVFQDLFGEWVILTYYGRNGYKGQRKQYGYTSFEDMHKKLKEIINKRYNSKYRIGINYTLTRSYVNKNYNQLECLLEDNRHKANRRKKISLFEPHDTPQPRTSKQRLSSKFVSSTANKKQSEKHFKREKDSNSKVALSLIPKLF